jgi:hypothetical protein
MKSAKNEREIGGVVEADGHGGRGRGEKNKRRKGKIIKR